MDFCFGSARAGSSLVAQRFDRVELGRARGGHTPEISRTPTDTAVARKIEANVTTVFSPNGKYVLFSTDKAGTRTRSQ